MYSLDKHTKLDECIGREYLRGEKRPENSPPEEKAILSAKARKVASLQSVG